MSNTQPLVSIIIPVYKVEKYLKDCVDSVRNQTYTNLEIILVDDGSPDRCGQMCDQYAAEDSRIRVIHQKNGGVSKARNIGLACSEGEYVFFADSDDMVADEAIEQLVIIAKKYDADMVCSAFKTVDEAGVLLEDYSAERNAICMDTQQALKYYAPAEWGPWNRLIRAQVHRGIIFPDYKIHEDEAIKFLLLERCKRVVQIQLPTYFYRQRTNSATSLDSDVNRMDMFYSRRENLDYLRKHHPDLVPMFLPKVCEDALLNLGVRTKMQHEEDTPIQELVQFFAENEHEIISCPYATKAQKIRCLLITRSNWTKRKNLYTRFYALLNMLRGRK